MANTATRRPMLHPVEALYLAIDALWTHKLRSGLTILGITIAVSSLISVVAVIDGMNRYVSERVGNFGPGVFVLTRYGIITNMKDWLEVQKRKRIYVEDYLALKQNLKLAKSVACSALGSCKVKAYNNSMDEVTMRGATPNLIQIGTLQVGSGRYISDQDDQRRTPVCFIGTDVADHLFGARDPVGRTLFLNGRPFEVIGVAAKQGSTFGESMDSFVHIPLGTHLKIQGVHNVSVHIHVQAFSPERIEAAQDEAELALRARRHLKMDQVNDFGIVTPTAVMGLWQSLTGTIAGVALALGAIFLFVGGVVVMNIMLAAVTERTREIGIRKAIGARKSDILMQFLVEAVTLTTAGGLSGVLIAAGLAALLRTFTPIPAHMPVLAVLLSLGISATVGLFFGLYPASRAASLDPIVAVRVE
jgi:putative ABC transport system permease protein